MAWSLRCVVHAYVVLYPAVCVWGDSCTCARPNAEVRGVCVCSHGRMINQTMSDTATGQLYWPMACDTPTTRWWPICGQRPNADASWCRSNGEMSSMCVLHVGVWCVYIRLDVLAADFFSVLFIVRTTSICTLFWPHAWTSYTECKHTMTQVCGVRCTAYTSTNRKHVTLALGCLLLPHLCPILAFFFLLAAYSGRVRVIGKVLMTVGFGRNLFVCFRLVAELILKAFQILWRLNKKNW